MKQAEKAHAYPIAGETTRQLRRDGACAWDMLDRDAMYVVYAMEYVTRHGRYAIATHRLRLRFARAVINLDYADTAAHRAPTFPPSSAIRHRVTAERGSDGIRDR